VAEDAIIDFWKRHVKPRCPNLRLVQKDKSQLRPRRKTGKTGIAPIDFLVIDTSRKRNNPIFGIENKTGRSSMREMSQFQLDISDCDSIRNDMKRLRIPAYVIHAQVLERWHAPTVGFKVMGLWWSDVYEMSKHFTGTQQRRDEMRGAAYFRKKAFSSIDSFATTIVAGGWRSLVKTYRRRGVPKMYR